MFCSKCGKDIPDDSVFCPECGQDVRRTTAPAPPVSAPPTPATSDVSQGLFIGILLGTLVFPLLGLVMGFIYMKDQSASKKKAGKTWLWVGIVSGIVWTLYWAGME